MGRCVHVHRIPEGSKLLHCLHYDDHYLTLEATEVGYTLHGDVEGYTADAPCEFLVFSQTSSGLFNGAFRIVDGFEYEASRLIGHMRHVRHN